MKTRSSKCVCILLAQSLIVFRPLLACNLPRQGEIPRARTKSSVKDPVHAKARIHVVGKQHDQDIWKQPCHFCWNQAKHLQIGTCFPRSFDFRSCATLARRFEALGLPASDVMHSTAADYSLSHQARSDWEYNVSCSQGC